MRYLANALFTLLVICCLQQTVYAASDSVDADYVPTRYGVGFLAGKAYDPDDFGLVIVQGQMLIDYDRVAWHEAPDPLRLKLEANLGIRTESPLRGLVSVNALALYYLEPFRWGKAIPYVEAGIGLIYTDFQVEDQGLRCNFNPQAGLGFEIPLENGAAVTTAIRLHHVSNGGLHKDNRGINSALLMVGYLF